VKPIVRGLHHAQITIPPGAEDPARAFYCGLLGLREVEKPVSLAGRGGFWLELGDGQLHVGSEDGVERAVTKAHLAYEVEALPRWRERLEEHAVPVLDSIPIPGYRRLEARDPFGNRFELIEELQEEES